MRNAFAVLALLPLAACVTANNVKPEDSAVVGNYSCEKLQQKLAELGVMRDQASQKQNRNSGGEVAGEIAADIITAPILPIGPMMQFYNQKNAEGNTKRVKAALDVYYQSWDGKKCSQWLYEKNAHAKP